MTFITISGIFVARAQYDFAYIILNNMKAQ